MFIDSICASRSGTALMRLATTFSHPAGWLAPYLVIASLLLSFVAVSVSVGLFLAVNQYQAERPALEEQLVRLRSRDATHPVEIPPQSQLIQLRDHVQRLNGLVGSAGVALSQLLPRLERLLPDTVWLLSLQHRSQEDETRLLVESDRAEQLTDFMQRLEQSRYFSQVLLTRKLQRTDGPRHTVQFEIQLRGQR
ncbi:MAG: PilN domain-containing protein [Gammaproteobacteria bacterium]|nr:PilN domain-containing protein [Gammaproteobacteria bacterium]